jgi:hypothetical protein
MVNKNYFSALFISMVALAVSSAYAEEAMFPAVQLGGEFYRYPEAVKLKGGKFSKASNGRYVVSFGNENVPVETNGSGLESVRSSLFPETVLLNLSN